MEAGRRLGKAAAFAKGDPAPLVAAGEALVARAERRAAAAAASTSHPGLKMTFLYLNQNLTLLQVTWRRWLQSVRPQSHALGAMPAPPLPPHTTQETLFWSEIGVLLPLSPLHNEPWLYTRSTRCRRCNLHDRVMQQPPQMSYME